MIGTPPMPDCLQLDHLVVTAESLAAGVDHVEAALGARMVPGGRHPDMATHNALLSLGAVYLEVIAVDPAARAPARARWFGLDTFSGPPRLCRWVARTDDLKSALALAPRGSGVPMALSRGDLSWSMAVSSDGRLPFDDTFPAPIAWQGPAHPAARLPASGCSLTRLQVFHPHATALRGALTGLGDALADCVAEGPLPAFRAEISTPAGTRVLT